MYIYIYIYIYITFKYDQYNFLRRQRETFYKKFNINCRN